MGSSDRAGCSPPRRLPGALLLQTEMTGVGVQRVLVSVSGRGLQCSMVLVFMLSLSREQEHFLPD